MQELGAGARQGRRLDFGLLGTRDLILWTGSAKQTFFFLALFMPMPLCRLLSTIGDKLRVCATAHKQFVWTVHRTGPRSSALARQMAHRQCVARTPRNDCVAEGRLQLGSSGTGLFGCSCLKFLRL